MSWRRCDAVYFTAGDADAVRAARAARVLVATPRALATLAASNVRLDALVGSARDAGEAVRAGDLDPPPGALVQTEGASGGRYVCASGERGRFRAAPIEGPIVDTYGAGDSFAAGLTHALGAGLPLARRARVRRAVRGSRARQARTALSGDGASLPVAAQSAYRPGRHPQENSVKPMSFAASCLRIALASIATVAGVAPVLAADESLPPERPTTPYQAEVRNTYNITRPGGGSSGGDTFEIRVSGARLYQDSKIMEETTAIVDTEKHQVIEFDAKSEDKIAKKFPLSTAPIPYIDGRSALAAFDPDWPEPVVAGQEKVAGEKCTVLHYGKPAEDGIAACVSKQGVVMRAKIVFPNYEREFELLDFDAGKQDEKYFAPPKDFEIQDGGE